MSEPSLEVGPAARRAGEPTAWEILRHSFGVLAAHGPRLLAVTLTVYSPVILLLVVLLVLTWRNPAQLDVERLEAVVDNGCLYYLVQAALAFGIFQVLQGQVAISYGTAVRKVVRNFVDLVVVVIVAGLAMLVGFLLLVVPGVVLYCALFVIVPALVVEELGPIRAWRRSLELTKGHRWMIFRLVLAQLGFVLLLAFVVFLPVQLFLDRAALPGLELVSSLLFSVVVALFTGTLVAVAYHRLRAAEGGLDIDDVLETFE